jgi:hypothetical protein
VHRLVRTTVVAGLTGALALGAAWAGVGLTPVPAPTPALPTAGLPAGGGLVSGLPALQRATSASSTAALGSGQILVGAAKTNLSPDPEGMRAKGFPDARWETDRSKCENLAPEYLQRLLQDTQVELDHLVSAGSPWPENEDCIYQGGFGLGPTNAVSAFDTEYGLWVRSVAFSDGTDTLVLSVIDAEGWLYDYASKCTDCGSKQLAARLAADPELAGKGLSAKSFVLASTHSHASMDFIGGWGFVPDWYMKQVSDAILSNAKAAVLAMEPAVLETGEAEARVHNGERRDTYRSAEEQQLSWLRAVAVQEATTPEPSESPKGRKPTAEPTATASPAAPRVIATIGSYAAHPTTKNTNGGVAHADWPGLFEKRLETRFGGIALHFMTGLGNISASGGTSMGTRLADLVPPLGGGRLVQKTDLRVAQTTWEQPLTNVPLTALGTPGFFDRKFEQKPATLTTGKSPDTAPCSSASATSVVLPATAARIGDDLLFTTGPGELFSNVTNTVKEKNPGAIAFPMAQANDALGYMPQSFELNPVGMQGLGFAAGGAVFVNYEDSYAVDRCVGDMALETILALADSIR